MKTKLQTMTKTKSNFAVKIDTDCIRNKELQLKIANKLQFVTTYHIIFNIQCFLLCVAANVYNK